MAPTSASPPTGRRISRPHPRRHANGRWPDYLEEFDNLLVDAVQIRLRADVPVGAYLSGGLDSSIIAAIIRNSTSNQLDTFSIAFSDTQFDESAFQRQMAGFLGTDHQVVQATHADIGGVFPDVIWHTEIPIMRTSPAPMFLLSRLVRDSGYKVVLTGEGADEFLGGYDIFKEAKSAPLLGTAAGLHAGARCSSSGSIRTSPDSPKAAPPCWPPFSAKA